MAESQRRMLKIKTGSVNRLKKELGLYVDEKERERQKVARMKEEGADTYDIKHAVRLPHRAGKDTDKHIGCQSALLCHFQSRLVSARACIAILAMSLVLLQLCRRTSLRSPR